MCLLGASNRRPRICRSCIPLVNRSEDDYTSFMCTDQNVHACTDQNVHACKKIKSYGEILLYFQVSHHPNISAEWTIIYLFIGVLLKIFV